MIAWKDVATLTEWIILGISFDHQLHSIKSEQETITCVQIETTFRFWQEFLNTLSLLFGLATFVHSKCIPVRYKRAPRAPNSNFLKSIFRFQLYNKLESIDVNRDNVDKLIWYSWHEYLNLRGKKSRCFLDNLGHWLECHLACNLAHIISCRLYFLVATLSIPNNRFKTEFSFSTWLT